MRVTVFNKVNAIKFDKNGWNKAKEKAVATQVRMAAREWLKAARDSVPVWSGQVQGSLIFAQGEGGGLAEYLGISRQLTEIPEHSTAEKNPQTGALTAYYSFPTGQHKYYFRFNTTLDYFIWNDENPRPDHIKQNPMHPAPWRAKLNGNQAFQRYMYNTGLNKIPNLKSFMYYGDQLRYGVGF